MHDFPIDMEDFDVLGLQHSPSFSSTFHASNTVSSPSAADLTPTQVTFTWSSDDIPLVLYDEAYAQSPSLWDAGSASFADSGPRNSVISPGSGFPLQPSELAHFQALSPHSIDDRISDVPRSAASSFFDISSFRLRSSDSSATITSVGTFGQRKDTAGARSHIARGKDAMMVDEESVFRGQQQSGHHLTGLFARTGLSAVGKRVSLKVMTGVHLGDEQPQLLSPTSAERSGPRDILYIEDYDDEEPETPTPMKPFPKSISWISSQNWNAQQYKDHIAREGLARSPVSPSLNINTAEDRPSRRDAPIKPRAPLENRHINVILETPRTSQFARACATQESDREQPIQNHHHHPPVKQSIQQDHYAWLRHITVQFLIDQEGFRSARPSFKFTGVARLRSAHGAKAPGALMAQFRPITRETFHFHYAPFETPPILRRVTVDSDEMHDYLTRQAHLTLKSNGVYVLHGHEMSSISHEMEPVKLHWRFEYLVDDRRVEGSGRMMEGEKVLTPLTFSCTPAFALPSQGKRNTVMHVFKKGVASKLVAEKMQPPGIARPVVKSSHPNSPAETQASKFFSSKVHTWHIHKRGQSHSARAQTEGGNYLRPHLPFPWTDPLTQQHGGSENANLESLYIRHRRASSAGENQRVAPFSPVAPNRHHVSESDMNRRAIVRPSHHILPPARLAEMLDTPFSPAALSVQAHTPPRSSVAFTPLTPRPRHSPHLREPSHTK